MKSPVIPVGWGPDSGPLPPLSPGCLLGAPLPEVSIKVLVKPMHRYILLVVLLAGLAACGPTVKERMEQSDVHYELGVVHLKERNLADALKELTRAVEIYPDEPSYHNALGLAYFYKGMYGEAKASIGHAVRLDPEYSEAHLNLSAIHLDERNWQKAIAEAEAALDNIFYKTPEFAYVNIGWAYYNMGRNEEAVASYKKAVAQNQRYPQAYYNMGLAYEKLGRMDSAVDAYKRAVSISPGYVEALFRLGMALVKTDDKDGAREAFQRIIEISPGSDSARSAREYIELME